MSNPDENLEPTVVHFNHATWMAARVQAAAAITVAPVDDVVLPGALAPMSVKKVNAYLRAGMDAGQVAGRVNDQWRADNADRLNAQRDWLRARTETRLRSWLRRKRSRQPTGYVEQPGFEELTRKRDA